MEEEIKREAERGGSKKDKTGSRRRAGCKNKDMHTWNFIAIGPLSKLGVPLAVPKIKDHF